MIPWRHIFLIFCVTKCRLHRKHFTVKWNMMIIIRKPTCVTDCQPNEQLFPGTTFTWRDDWPAMVVQSSVFGRHFLINEWNGLSPQGKQWMVLVASGKIWAFRWNSQYFIFLGGSQIDACDKKKFPLRGDTQWLLWWALWVVLIFFFKFRYSWCMVLYKL